MKKFILLPVFAFCVGTSFAQSVQKMRDVFGAMPDSIMPLLTKNNRLDCIDFIENGIEAKIKNRVDEYSTLKVLTDDCLQMEISEANSVELKLVATSDSTCCVYMIETFLGPLGESHLTVFDQEWNRLELPQSLKPKVRDFFPAEVNDEAAQAIRELEDFPLIEAHFAVDEKKVTFVLHTEDLSRENKKAAQEVAQPVEVSLLLP